jgi:uncharacterized DUF497 family protein
MDPYELPLSCTGFDWDRGNLLKNWEKHRVAFWECEEVFLNQPLLLSDDTGHSGGETRFYALGKTESERALFLAFTVRQKKIRVISARDMNRREKKEYLNAEEKDPDF